MVDKRLTSNTQLVYRILMDLANEAYWAEEFVVTDSELMTIAHLRSKDILIGIKNRLVAMKYISCRGKPNRFTVYSPPDYNQPPQTDFTIRE